jgi:hypothetical protein
MFVVFSVLLILAYYLLSESQYWVYCVIVLNVTHVTMSISRGLHPKLDLRTANKLHYITLQIHVTTSQIFKINLINVLIPKSSVLKIINIRH